MLFSVVVYSQELPKVIPPSPNAAAFHVYGNTAVNHYTGAPNIQIPIYTIKEGDLTLPIYLKYSAGNGVKVEDIASWVGLGWTLNTGGAVSRTIRGIADDDQQKTGLFNMTGIPVPIESIRYPGSLANGLDFKDIIDGNADGESDKFFYNFPNNSGSFFYDYNENVYSKPKGHLDISHTIGVETENSISSCTTYNKLITDFTIKDENGITYFFKDKERSNTVTFGQNYTDNRCFASSWFLNKITNLNKTRSINLEYDTYNYQLVRRSGSFTVKENQLEQDVYTETSYISKRLNKITFSNGSVEFITSTSNRKDFTDNKYLSEIHIKRRGVIIKKFVFNYNYLTPSGQINVNASNSFYEEENRLLLTSITECNSEGECLPATEFEYDTQNLLPSRNSKAQDHWGYYNGQHNNTTYEPLRQIIYYGLNNTDEYGLGNYIDVIEAGKANKQPDFNYGKSGILTSIKHPTGGKTNLEYESHIVVNDDLKRNPKGDYVNLPREDVIYPFDIDLYSNRFPITKLSAGIAGGGHSQYDVRIRIKKVSNNKRYSILIPSAGNSSPLFNSSLYLPSGSYEASFTFESNIINNPSSRDPLLLILSWEEESQSNEIPIGGVRLKQTLNYTKNTDVTPSLITNYSYDGDDGKSSGRLVNIPIYDGFLQYGTTLIQGYRRYVKPVVSLSTTQGSYVGYGKVSKEINAGENGKEEFYYTTSDDYPDGFNSVNGFTNLPDYKFINGIRLYPFLNGETNDNDFLRGNLLKNIKYKKTETGLKPISALENEYFVSYSAPGASMSIIDEEPAIIKNLKASAGNYLTYYYIYSGFNLNSKTKETHYYDSGNETTITNYDYERIDNAISYFVPTETTSTSSSNKTLKTETSYVFNKANLSSTENTLASRNALYIPLESKSYIEEASGAEKKLSEQNTIYKNFNGLYLPEKVQVSKGSQSMEDRIVYHSYDEGNPVEVSKKDGTKIYYVWGYDKTQTIAKIEGYTSISPTQLSYINQAISASNSDDSRCLDSENCTEKTLRDKLKILRNNFSSPVQVTSFTYDPLIGVTSITDPRGDTIYYHYDSFNRLEYVKDAQGNVLSKNEYNYKN